MQPSALAKSKRAPAAKQVPRRGYAFLHTVLDGIDDGAVLVALQRPQRPGRPAYPVRALWRASLSKYALNIRFTVDLVARLQASKAFRAVCGFASAVPSESTFSRFLARLRALQPVVDECQSAMVSRLAEALPGVGVSVSVDSTGFPAYANPNRKTISDPDARWGVKTSNRAKSGSTEWVFGYKLHQLNCADHGVPLASVVTSAEVNDTGVLRPLLEQALENHPWLKPGYLIADRGYDSLANHKAVLEAGVTSVIHIRKSTAKDGLHDGIFDSKGSPTCMGKASMEFVRTDPESGRHLFQCKPGGCPLKAKSNGGWKYCDSEVWEDPLTNLRVIGVLPRAAPEWKRQYKKRTGIERTFRSLKHSRLLDRHSFRGIAKVRLHATLSLLAYTATMLARATQGDLARVRDMRI